MSDILSFTPTEGDGYIRNNHAVWATCQSAVTGASVDYTSGQANGAFAGHPSDYYIDRVFLPFNTSGLPDLASIVSATLTFYITAGINNADTSDVRIVQTTQPSSTVLAVEDFDLMGTTNGGSKNLANLTNAANNTIDLNATGLTWISLTGITYIGLRIGRDIDNSAPTGSNQIANMYFSESLSDKPTLAVTYNLTATNNYLNDYRRGSSKI